MHGFATYILRGRFQAIVVTAVVAVLSMLLPPLSHVSGAVVGLVTLRNGVREGVFVAIATALLLLLVGLLSSMAGALVQMFVLGLLAAWLPVLICATVLRSLRSMDLALTAIGLLALLSMIVFYLVVGDAAAWWLGLLEAWFDPVSMQLPENMTAAELSASLHDTAGIMTGVVAVMLMYSTMIKLCLARWWQSLLFNPGGFRKEFHGLRLDRRITIAVIVLAALSSLLSTGQQGFAQDVMLLILGLYSILGLAFAHALVTARGLHGSTLIVAYVLMLFILPIAVLGLTDSLLDLRRRLGIKPAAPGAS